MNVACLDLPALPLQLVWRAEPDLRSQAVVVIDEDRPQGLVLWACERARRAGVLPGQRYAHALSLHRALRARVVPPEKIAGAIAELRAALHEFSPRVDPGGWAEPSRLHLGPSAEPGTFWLDGDGLDRIFGGAAPWAMAIQRGITIAGFTGAVVVGFSRFATYAIARATKTGITVLATDADERTAASAVPLARLDIDPKLRDALARLERLVPMVYAELHRLAHRQMRHERPGHTLQTSALVNETYLRLVDYARVRPRDGA